MAKFYHNNSYVYLNINKNEGVEGCKRCVNGRCVAKGCACSGWCQDFISVNSKVAINSPLKDKTHESREQSVDYSKAYSITVYILQGLKNGDIIKIYISNKDYELDGFIKLDVSDVLADRLRRLLSGKEFVYNGEIYILKDRREITIKKNN